MGAEINAVKQLLNEQISERKESLQRAAIAAQLEAESLDVTLPGRREDLGALHRLPARLTAWRRILQRWVLR